MEEEIKGVYNKAEVSPMTLLIITMYFEPSMIGRGVQGHAVIGPSVTSKYAGTVFKCTLTVVISKEKERGHFTVFAVSFPLNRLYCMLVNLV